METKTQTTVKPTKVIDDETRLQAARYISYDIRTTTALSRADIYQEAWIALGTRMGKPFYMSMHWTRKTLLQKFFGRDLTDEQNKARYLLKHDSFDDEIVVDPSYTPSEDNYSESYNELELFAKQTGYEEEFYALAHSELTDVQPYEQVMRNRRIKKSQAFNRLSKFKKAVQEHYDLDFFND